MNELNTLIGRDPVMDHALANVARGLYDFERTLGTDLDAAQTLETKARQLWSAVVRLDREVAPRQHEILRATIRRFIVECREAERRLLREEPVLIGAMRRAFGEVVRRYRRFTMMEQAVRYEDRFLDTLD